MAKIKLKRKKARVTYSGSLIQQSFGESVEKHGFLVWDLETLTYEEVDIQNDYGFYTLNVDNGIVPDVKNIPKYAHLRVKLSNTDAAGTKRAIMEIKRKYKIKDFSIIRTDTISKIKTGNRLSKLDFDDVSDIHYQNTLITDYLSRMLPHLSDDELKTIELINTDLNSKIKIEDIHRNIFWKPIRFEFSNMFSYGESNIIDFNKISGLTGLFAPNASGKSSLFDAICFCLYDKCSRAFKATNIMNNRKSTFSCQFDFEINGVEFHIRREARTVNKGKNVKVDVQFWKVENGIALSLNGTERRDTNMIIEQYVGRYEDFVLTTLSLQGNNALFIDKSQSERKELLAQFMGLNIFDALYEKANDDIKEVSALIKNFKKVDFTTELNNKVIEITDLRLEAHKVESALESQTKEKENAIENILSLSKQIEKINAITDIQKLVSKKEDILSSLITLELDKDKALQKIEKHSKYLSELQPEIQQKEKINDTPIKEVKLKFDSIKDEIKTIKHKIQLLEQSINANKEKLSHLEKHEYDPNCKFCINNVFVKDAISTKEILKEQIELLSLNNSKLDDKIKDFKRIDNADILWQEFNEINDKYKNAVILKEKLQSELVGLRTKEQLFQHQLEVIGVEIEKYYSNEETIKKNTSIELEIEKFEKIKNEKDKEIKSSLSKKTELVGKIATIKSYIDECKAKIKETRELEEKYQMYEYYLDAIKRDGVPYEMISKALPIIESEVNNILGQVVDFHIVMEVDGKNINAKIVYDDQEWALEMCSGMEKFISGIAIRVALINICNLPRPNFLVIDEGFGSLDSDNISSLFMMMQYLKTQFDFIWIISHLDQMRDMVDGIIEIKKVNGFSSIGS